MRIVEVFNVVYLVRIYIFIFETLTSGFQKRLMISKDVSVHHTVLVCENRNSFNRKNKVNMKEKEIKRILDIYNKEDICIADLLADVKVPKGISYEQAFEIYIQLLKMIEKDNFYRIADNELKQL